MTYYVVDEPSTDFYTVSKASTTFYTMAKVSTTFYVIYAVSALRTWKALGDVPARTWARLKELGLITWKKLGDTFLLRQTGYITMYYSVDKPDTTYYEVSI